METQIHFKIMVVHDDGRSWKCQLATHPADPVAMILTENQTKKHVSYQDRHCLDSYLECSRWIRTQIRRKLRQGFRLIDKDSPSRVVVTEVAGTNPLPVDTLADLKKCAFGLSRMMREIFDVQTEVFYKDKEEFIEKLEPDAVDGSKAPKTLKSILKCRKSKAKFSF